jgi:rubrerythrin
MESMAIPRQIQALEGQPRQNGRPRRLDLACSVCGYGALCASPPERCPMCQMEGTWTHTPWRPFSRARAFTG